MKFKTAQQRANSVARANGYGSATTILFEENAKKDYVKKHIHFDYRKHTTGEYVSIAYRANFGWKNTYYQHAETVVVLAIPVPYEFKIEKM